MFQASEFVLDALADSQEITKSTKQGPLPIQEITWQSQHRAKRFASKQGGLNWEYNLVVLSREAYRARWFCNVAFAICISSHIFIWMFLWPSFMTECKLEKLEFIYLTPALLSSPKQGKVSSSVCSQMLYLKLDSHLLQSNSVVLLLVSSYPTSISQLPSDPPTNHCSVFLKIRWERNSPVRTSLNEL